MKLTPNKTERIHSLDSLRATMMLLGLVIHSALTYGVINYGNVWIIKDQAATHLFNDYIVYLIHAFRMPIFFIIAGFFGAMLFYERKPLKMIENRISRIVYPFIIFLFILYPVILFTFNYTNAVFSKGENAFEEALAQFSSIDVLIPDITFHLWFLYYLIFITFVSIGLGLLFKKLPVVKNKIKESFNWVIQKPILRVLVFAVLTFVLYLFIGVPLVETSDSLIPDLNTFGFYFFFYIAGWVLFKSKHLLDALTRYDWISTILGLVLLTIQFLMYESLNSKIHMVLNSIIVWLFIFGITGLFIHYGSEHSLRMRYISDSSYWVYLIHLPLPILIPGLISDWSLPALAKFLIVLITSVSICFITYHYLVRATFIGKFLNGRKYPRKTKNETLEKTSAYYIKP